MTRTRTLTLAGGVAACALLAVLVDRALAGDDATRRTDDACVTTDFSLVTPKVAGSIDRMEVDDNALVKAGQEVAHIDDRDYREAVALAQASLAAARADVDNLGAELERQKSVIDQANAIVASDDAALVFAQASAQRYGDLSRDGAGTLEQQQQAASQLQQATSARVRDGAVAAAAHRQTAVLGAQRDRAVADVQRQQAALEQARLNLSYTHILAPVDGTVGQRSGRVGNYVSPGTALLAVVPLQSAYVLANFQETQLAGIEAGQRARIRVDAFPGQVFTGTVDSLAPANGLAFSPIQPDNATGNFTKVVQRLALKIRLDPAQPQLQHLRVGMSVEAEVDTARGGLAAQGDRRVSR